MTQDHLLAVTDVDQALLQEVAEAAEQVLRETQDYDKRILRAALTAGGGVVAALGLLSYALWGPAVGKEWAALLAFCLFSALTLIVAGLLGVIVQLSRQRLMRRLVDAAASVREADAAELEVDCEAALMAAGSSERFGLREAAAGSIEQFADFIAHHKRVGQIVQAQMRGFLMRYEVHHADERRENSDAAHTSLKEIVG